jgi:transposase
VWGGQSESLAKYESEKLTQRLSKAETGLLSLTPEPGRGKRQYRDEATFHAAVAKILEQYKVTGLLDVTWQREEQKRTGYVGRGRGGPNQEDRNAGEICHHRSAAKPFCYTEA